MVSLLKAQNGCFGLLCVLSLRGRRTWQSIDVNKIQFKILLLL